jgi:hypothetical protein
LSRVVTWKCQIRGIQCGRHRQHRAGAAPQREQERNGQDPAGPAPADLDQLLVDDPDHVGRRDTTQNADDLVDQAFNRTIAGDRDERQERSFP